MAGAPARAAKFSGQQWEVTRYPDGRVRVVLALRVVVEGKPGEEPATGTGEVELEFPATAGAGGQLVADLLSIRADVADALASMTMPPAGTTAGRAHQQEAPGTR